MECGSGPFRFLQFNHISELHYLVSVKSGMAGHYLRRGEISACNEGVTGEMPDCAWKLSWPLLSREFKASCKIFIVRANGPASATESPFV